MRLTVTAAVSIIAMTLSPQGVRAQLRANAGPVGVVSLDSDPARSALRGRAPQSHPDSAQHTASRVWPRYAGVGGVLGGLAVIALAVTNCDQHCQDDGALGFLPPYILAGAAVGAVVGAIVGLIVDGTPRAMPAR